MGDHITKGEREAFSLGILEVLEMRPLRRVAKSLISNRTVDKSSGLRVARNKRRASLAKAYDQQSS